MENTPYIGFANETLEGLPAVEPGYEIDCDKCGGKHTLQAGRNMDTGEDSPILFYECGGNSYLGAIASRSVVGVKSDVSGTVGGG